ncbi:YjbH domain-containing protein [Amaricoccus sp.]|mgnify:CR=1 FL=1|uniref:YjbH domain-containing protein n=1 Tax=Amaricoccus sp. TaxID=1872485 RepID=UPI00262FD1A0|nr:YjbH domain-containing protein [Amaricoccus sp.]HRO11747.1 YjbH domain-containing protein [Amaricoccus sp.]
MLALAAAASIAPGTTAPAQETAPPRPSLNLYGATGLIDMPSAEAQPDAQVSASYSQFGNTSRRNFTFQLLPRISATLRYASIKDWGNSDDPEYKLFDRSLDVQFQLLKERGTWQPSVALGFRDVLGTGVYSAEYLVASKTIARDFTVTGGIGWGRLASVGGVTNPFCSMSDSFCERKIDYDEGGTPTFDAMFHGEDMGFFGGVEWRTPIDKLTLKAEISSDAYTREQAGPEADFERKSPINVGAEYRLTPGITLGGYYMYGSTVGINVVVSGNPYKPLTPQNLGTGPVPINPRPANANRSGAWVNDQGAKATLTEAVAKALNADGITLDAMSYTADAVEVRIINRQISQDPKAIGRTAAVLAAAMPYSVERFSITPLQNGLPTTTVTVQRTDLEAQANRPFAGVQSWETTQIEGALPVLAQGQSWRRDVYPLWSWAFIPLPTVQIFGGNDGFRPQLTLQFRGSVSLSPGLSASAMVRQPLLGEFSDPGDTESSGNLPQVRSQSKRYYSGWDPKLIRLTGDYLFKLNRDTYGRVSAGLLERAFGGVSGEVLWKPVEQSWGLGAELNYVAQRDPYSPFGFGYYDYQVATGHASVYWDTGWYGIETQLSAGRYLAGDWGATLAVSRRFANGWAVGAYATKTDVSAEDFGEGSFAKGLTLSIPLRWSTPFETRQTIDGNLTSLANNGGAFLNIQNRLYPMVREYDRNRLERNWGAFWQ